MGWLFEMDVLCCTRGADPTDAQVGTRLQRRSPGSISAFPSLETKIQEWEPVFPHSQFSSKMPVLRHGIISFC